MAKQTVLNNDSGIVARTKLNDNFTDLYDTDTSLTSSKVTKAGDTMTGALSLPSEVLTGQSATVAPLNITPGTKKAIPLSGDIENEGQNYLYTDSGATRKALSGIIFSQYAPKTINATTTETSLFSTTAYVTTPTAKQINANSLKVGSTIRIKLTGLFSTAAGGTANLRVKLGSVELSNIVETFANNRTNYWFEKEITLICTAAGVNGALMCAGRSLAQDSAAGGLLMIPLNPLNASTVINTTIDAIIDVTFQWGQTTHSISTHSATIEILC